MGKLLTAERLREVIHYDVATGVFTWLISTGRVSAGHVAGSASRGRYRQIKIDGVNHYAHRLAWLYVKGEWPIPEIDHRDVDGMNNRWSNLRLATASQNGANTRAQRNNPTGLKGAFRVKRANRWKSQIMVSGRLIYLGTFDTATAAHAVYRKAAKQHFGEYGRTA